jgi:hypothetical protein
MGVETVQLVRTRRQVVYGVCFLVHRRNSSCRSRPAIIKVPVRVHVRIAARPSGIGARSPTARLAYPGDADKRVAD